MHLQCGKMQRGIGMRGEQAKYMIEDQNFEGALNLNTITWQSGTTPFFGCL